MTVRVFAVPILKMRNVRTDIMVDISVDSESLDNAELSRTYVEEFPKIKPLFLVLKKCLLGVGLNDGSRGGLSSFVLLMLLVCYFKVS